MDYINFFYSNIHGCYPSEDNKAYIKTGCTIDYLFDNKFTPAQIIKIMFNYDRAHVDFNPEFFSQKLWDNSLLEKGKYYFHKELQIISSPPIISKKGKEVETEFYIEPRILYTIENVLDYFCKKCLYYKAIKDNKKFIAQLNTLINKYNKIDSNIAGIDLLLHVIDYASIKQYKIFQPFDIDTSENISEVYDILNKKYQNGKSLGVNRYKWRTKYKMRQ